jgi:hypothetical protein
MFKIIQNAQKVFFSITLYTVLAALPALAQVSGKIGGTVKDQTGAVIPNAPVAITERTTGISQRTSTDVQGAFTFPVVRVGTYDIDINMDGFKPYKRPGLVVDVGSALQIDIFLDLATVAEEVSVTDQGAVVEVSDTQLGQVIDTKQIVEVPLNGRNFTDLFAIQAGVTPLTTSGAGNSSSGGGFGTVPVAGNTNTGQFSIHGHIALQFRIASRYTSPIPPLPSRAVISCEPSCVPMVNAMISQGIIELRKLVDEKPA